MRSSLKRASRLMAAVAATLGVLVLGSSESGAPPPPEAAGVMTPPAEVGVTPSGRLPDLVKILEGDTVKHLFDGDTTTSYTAYGPSRVRVKLAGPRQITAIKVHGAPSHKLTVKALAGGQLTAVAGLGQIDLRTLGAGWHVLAPTQPVTTAELEFTLEPQTQLGLGATGIAEIEVWGAGAHVNATAANASGAAPPPPQTIVAPSAAETGGEGLQIGGEGAPATARIEFNVPHAPGQIRQAFLVYELAGLTHWSEAARSINGSAVQGGHVRRETTQWSQQIEPLAPALLLKGLNTVVFRAIVNGSVAYRVRNARLVVEPFDGWNAIDRLEANQPGGALALDGDLATGWALYPGNVAERASEPTIAAEFVRAIALDRARLHVSAPVTGTFVVETRSDGSWLAVGQPQPGSSLAPGWNTLPLGGRAATAVRLRFSGGDGAGAIGEFEVAGSPEGASDGNPALTISYPDAGQFFGDMAYIRGFLRPEASAAGPANIVIGGKPASVNKGAFEAAVSKADLGVEAGGSSWSVTVDAVYPDGRNVSRAVQLTQNIDALRNDAADGTQPSVTSDIPAGAAKTLTLAGASLDIEAGALTQKTRIVMQALRDVDMARPDAGLVNVTRNTKGYRFLPHGRLFAKKATVRLPYDKAKLPQGFAETDIRTFYFDGDRGAWIPLELVRVDTAKAEVVSLTDHFTDMVNGVVAVPEHPETTSFNPTQFKDMKAANPGAKVNVIAPPEANAMGEVRLSYPMELPPGRTGHAPSLGLSYSSSGENGWLGMGWDLSMSMMTIDTRWGVPRYLSDKESETYMLDGEQLTMFDGGQSYLAHRAASFANRTPAPQGKIFHTRVEGQFREIRRFGETPETFRWEVREKDGTAYFYGALPGSAPGGLTPVSWSGSGFH